MHLLGLRSLGLRSLGLRSLGLRSLGPHPAGLRATWPHPKPNPNQVYGYLAACIFDVPLYRAAPASHAHGQGSGGHLLELAAGTGWLALLLPPLILALLDTCSDATCDAARRRRPWVVGGLSVLGLAWPPVAWALGYYGRDRVVHVGLPELGFILASVGVVAAAAAAVVAAAAVLVAVIVASHSPRCAPPLAPTPTPTPTPIYAG